MSNVEQNETKSSMGNVSVAFLYCAAHITFYVLNIYETIKGVFTKRSVPHVRVNTHKDLHRHRVESAEKPLLLRTRLSHFNRK